MAQPLKKYRAGQVSAALWENQANVNGRSVTMLKVSIERRYRDKDEKWQSSNSFGRNEIPLAIHVLQQAFGDIIQEQQSTADVEQELVE